MFINRTVSSAATTEMHALTEVQLDAVHGGHSITATVAAMVILTAEVVALTGAVAANKVANAVT